MGHYSDSEPASAGRRRQLRLVLPERTLELATQSGVFSPTRVDTGTRFLVQRAPSPPAEGHLLDLGCGYGPLSLALALRSPRARVWAVDVNRRALDLTAANAVSAGIGNVAVARPDEVPGGIRFAAVWSNPPVHVGRAALRQLLVHWLGRLGDGGRCHLVVHRHLGADSLATWLADEGFPTRRTGSRRGYRLLEVAPRGAGL